MRLCVRLLPIFISFMAGVSQAAPKYGMAGCGLGSIVMGPRSGQVSAATTNGSFTSQGFGITMGTSNCLTDKQMAAVTAQESFLTENMSVLSKEIAQGNGETLSNFAYTFGCDQSVIPVFSSHMQKSYRKIFAAPGAMAALETIRDEIKSDESLNKSCPDVI